jgi:hypothetical protein
MRQIEIDYKRLGEELTKAGLVGKPVDEYNKEEVEKLCNACISAINPKKISKFTKPFIDERGTLVIPADADPRYFYWAKCGQSIYETLRELNVSDEIWKKYTDASEAPF